MREVLDAYRDTEPSATVFATPTVLDLPMSNVYFSAPKFSNVGHAVGLAPRSDCTHLTGTVWARPNCWPMHRGMDSGLNGGRRKHEPNKP